MIIQIASNLKTMVVSSSPTLSLKDIGQKTRQAALKLSVLPTTERDRALEAIAQSLEAHQPEIVAANQADCEAASQEGIAPSVIGSLENGRNEVTSNHRWSQTSPKFT